jgi:ABC-type uncharacterized transport system permease subunit
MPVVVGEKVTLIVQLALVASVVPQVEVETANGAAAEYEIPVNVVGRLFFNVTFLAALVVPTFCFANVRLLGVRVVCTMPVPESGTV